ncbi:MAG: hypothetical protein LBI15_11440 [Dysgonamonadaceae bacterium]|jgi:hypothetical protein|nr:hypothetical protein [Dysgonamonadaceae bacterium]
MRKDSIIISLSIGLLIAAVVACTSLYNDDNNNSTSIISAEQRTEIEQAGIFHNKTLDAILVDLQKEKVRLFQESINLPTELRSATTAETLNVEQVAYNTTLRLMKEWGFVQNEQEFQAIYSNQLLHQMKNSTKSAFEIEVVKQLTPFQADYYHRLMNIVESREITLDQFLTEIAALEVQIEQNAPTVEEAVQLLYIASITRHATEYWCENAAKWLTVLHSKTIDIMCIDEFIGKTTLRSSVLGDGRPLVEGDAFPFPSDATLFYLYEDGVVKVQECPGGLYFCPVIKTCNWLTSIEIEAEREGWWNSWGRCVIGTVGSAGAGATVGAIAGSKWGAILGALFGGMVGAATFC